jgi:hypothetical protein
MVGARASSCMCRCTMMSSETATLASRDEAIVSGRRIRSLPVVVLSSSDAGGEAGGCSATGAAAASARRTPRIGWPASTSAIPATATKPALADPVRDPDGRRRRETRDWRRAGLRAELGLVLLPLRSGSRGHHASRVCFAPVGLSFDVACTETPGGERASRRTRCLITARFEAIGDPSISM